MSERAELHVIRVTTCCLMRSGVRAAEAHAKRDRSRLLKAFGMAVAMGMAACLFASSMPTAVSGQTPEWSLSSEYRVSDLSGDVGDRTQTLDLEVNGLQVLRIGQQGGGSYRPCNAVLLGRGPGDYREDTSRTRLNWNRCVSYLRDDPGWTRVLEGVYSDDFYIKSLRVCQTRKKNDRIKGLQSGAVRVTASGEIAETDSQSMTNSDCAEWHRLVRCRPDEVASGTRIRYNGASQTPEFTGLELICRKVISMVSETARSGLESSDADGAEAERAPEIAIEGNWLRRDSNNPQNDGMRISVEGDRATLTAIPGSGHDAFRVGHVLWKGISNDGRLEVRGSNGRYYGASITMEGANRLHIDIDDDPGPGYEQTWERAGPSIDGDWVLVEASDGANEGLHVQVQGSQATLRFVPPTASRSYRVGARTWRNIGGGDQPHLGELEALTTSREYRAAQFHLINENRLRLVFDAGGTVQLWVRPGVAEEHIAARERGEPLADVPQPQEPVDDPLAQGGDLNPPGEERGVEVPEDLPPMESKCLTTSLANDRTDVGWRWEIETQMAPYNSALQTEEGISGARHGELVADVDRSYAPGVRDHFASIATDDGGGPQYRDLSADELETRIELLKSEGYRLADLEGYTDSGDVRYAGVWVSNPDEIDWVPAFGRTVSEYESLLGNLRDSGYRLADLEVYSTPEGLRYAGIWVRSCDNTNWRQDTDLTKEQFEARAAELTPLGFNIVDFESYESDSGQLYGAIWEKISGRAWTVARDQDLKWFLNHHRRYTDLGARLIDYESYRSSDGIRYAGVWAENARRYQYAAKSAIDDSINNYLSANDLPGISVVIIRDGDTLYRRGFGFADTAQQKWAHSKTVYLLASVAKAVGGTLAARLEEQGVGNLDLDAETGAYLPATTYHRGTQFYIENCFQNDLLLPDWECQDIPAVHAHTVAQLLSKTGCTSHYREGSEPDASTYYHWRVEALNQMSRNRSLLNNCTPGMHYRYSTHGFTYVGAVLETVARKQIAELVRDEIAIPFELPSLRAMYTSQGRLGYPSNYDRATAYTVNNKAENTNGLLATPPHPQQNPTVPTNYSNTSWKVLGGGIEAHSLDLARLGWKVLNGEIVSPATRDNRLWSSLTGSATAWVDTSTSPSTTPSSIPGNGVGLAWVLGGSTTSSNGRWVRHAGDFVGSGTIIKIWRDRGLVIVLLSNRRFHENRFRNRFLDGLANVVLAAPSL